MRKSNWFERVWGRGWYTFTATVLLLNGASAGAVVHAQSVPDEGAPQLLASDICPGPHGDPSDACPVPTDADILDVLQEPGTANVYLLDVPRPEMHLQLDLTDLPADYDLYLFTPGQGSFQSVQEGLGPRSISTFLSAAGPHLIYVVVDPAREAAPGAPYQLHIQLEDGAGVAPIVAPESQTTNNATAMPVPSTATPVLPPSTPVVPTPTPVPPTPVPTVLYKADFSANSNDWQLVEKNALWTSGGGMLSSARQYWNSTILAPYRPASADYALEAEAQTLGGNTWYLVARYDSGEFVAAGLCIFAEYAEIQTSPSGLGCGRGGTGKMSFDSNWHTYRVEVQGSDYRFYVDGALTVRWNDATILGAGRVGLFAGSNTRVNVRAFRVLSL